MSQKSEGDEIDYPYMKILYWFYEKEDRRRALPFCARLQALLDKMPFSLPHKGEGLGGGTPLLGSLALTPPASALPTRREEVWSASS